MAALARRVSARLSRTEPSAAPAAVSTAGAPTTGAPTAGVPSWEQIVTDHSARVYRLAYRLTGNQHEAEDLTQDVFVRVFRSLDGYTPDNFEGWLHRITTNLFLDKVRRKARVRFDALSDEAAARLVSNGTVPDRQVVDSLFDDDVERALADLPEEFRAAVVLCDVEGMSYDEIAEALAIKSGTVRSRIHRGRKLLRSALAHRAPAGARTRFAGPIELPGVAVAGAGG